MFLAGEWGRSEAACAAGLVMVFRPDRVTLQDGAQETALLLHVRYRVAEGGQGREVAISHRLPAGPGAPGGRGLVVLRQTEAGGLAHVAERYTDARTGALRVPLEIENAALAAAFPVLPCAGPGFEAGLKGPTHRNAP